MLDPRLKHSGMTVGICTDYIETFELFSFEVFSVLNRLHPQPRLVFEKGVIPLLQGGLLRMPMTEPLAALAQRFIRLGLTGYDACYAALARDLSGLWLTYDQQAHRAIKKEKVSWSLEKGLPPGWPPKVGYNSPGLFARPSLGGLGVLSAAGGEKYPSPGGLSLI
jgi:predicted nucleic acid-binding protein